MSDNFTYKRLRGLKIDNEIYSAEGIYPDLTDINEDEYLVIIGNGEKNEQGEIVHSNAYTLKNNGDAWFAGDVYVGKDQNTEALIKESELANYSKKEESVGRKTETGGEIFNDYEDGPNIAIGQYSHAEGRDTKAGDYYITENGQEIQGIGAHAEGISTQAYANASHAEGHETQIGHNANASHAEGNGTRVLDGMGYAHAEGFQTVAGAYGAHTEGYQTFSTIGYQHVQGRLNKNFGPDEETLDSGPYAHIVGNGRVTYDENNNPISTTRSNAHTLDWNGNAWFAGDIYIGGTCQNEGKKIAIESKIIGWKGNGKNSEVFNTQMNTADGDYSHAEGTNTQANGSCSHAEGYYTYTSGFGSHAEGSDTVASNDSSHAEGYSTYASGKYSHAEGNNTEAYDECTHAEGYYTQAIGKYSHAEGSNTKAIGQHSHAEGNTSTAHGISSHAENQSTVKDDGLYGHSEGYGTIANGRAQHVQGRYNLEDKIIVNYPSSDWKYHQYAHIVGNGTSDTNRSNAHTLDWDGNAWFAGKVTAGSNPTEEMDLVTLQYLNKIIPPYNASEDEGKILRIVNGIPQWVSLPNAENTSF